MDIVYSFWMSFEKHAPVQYMTVRTNGFTSTGGFDILPAYISNYCE